MKVYGVFYQNLKAYELKQEPLNGHNFVSIKAIFRQFPTFWSTPLQSEMLLETVCLSMQSCLSLLATLLPFNDNVARSVAFSTAEVSESAKSVLGIFYALSCIKFGQG